jgi:hypothetical protein
MITIDLLNKIAEMYYVETNREIESITIDEYSFNILKNNLHNVIGKPKQLELYTPVGKMVIKCSQVDLIEKTKKEIAELQKTLKELQEFQNT